MKNIEDFHLSGLMKTLGSAVSKKEDLVNNLKLQSGQTSQILSAGSDICRRLPSSPQTDQRSGIKVSPSGARLL